MKKFFISALALASLVFMSCEDEGEVIGPVEATGAITEDTTWSADQIMNLKGRVL